MLEVDDEFKQQNLKLSFTSLSFLVFLVPLSLALVRKMTAARREL